MDVVNLKVAGPIRRALVTWLGGSFAPATAEDFLSYWNASGTKAGQSVTQKSVLELSAAWACNRLISETGGALPLFLYQRTDNGRVKAIQHPIYNLLHVSPNSESSPGTFWEAMYSAMLLRGNAFAEIQRVGQRIVGLVFLDPSRFNPEKQLNGTYKYYYYKDGQMRREILWANIFHVPGFSLDGSWGVSAIQYGSAVFGSAQAAQTAANSNFEKGLLPTTAFTIDRVIAEDQRDKFRTYVKTISGAMNSGESPLLEKGMGTEQIGISPKDAQLLETRTFSVEEVCRWFRVDPSMVGHGGKDSNFGTGLETKTLGFLIFTMTAWLNRVEQAIDRQLLTPVERASYFSKYNANALLRTDSKSRADFYSIMVINGILTRDEVREFEDLPRLGGNAGELTVNSATTTLDDLAGPAPAGNSPSGLTNILGADNGLS